MKVDSHLFAVCASLAIVTGSRFETMIVLLVNRKVFWRANPKTPALWMTDINDGDDDGITAAHSAQSLEEFQAMLGECLKFVQFDGAIAALYYLTLLQRRELGWIWWIHHQQLCSNRLSAI
jgi:hypothetical protein